MSSFEMESFTNFCREPGFAWKECLSLSEHDYLHMIRFIETSDSNMPFPEKREKPWVLAVVELFCKQKSPTREVMAEFAGKFLSGILSDRKLRSWICSKENVSPHRLDNDPYGFGQPGIVMMGWLFANLDKVRAKTGQNGWEGVRRYIAAQANVEAAEQTAAKYLYTVMANTVRRELAKGNESALLAKRISEMLAEVPEFVEPNTNTWVLKGGEAWAEDAGLNLDSITDELLANSTLHPLIDKAQQRPMRREMRTFLHAVWASHSIALTTEQIKHLIHQFFGVVSESARMTSIEELKERTGREPGDEDIAEFDDEDDDEAKQDDCERADEEDQIDPGAYAEELQRGATEESKTPISDSHNWAKDRAKELLLHVKTLDGGRLYHPTEKAKRGSLSQEFLGFIVWLGRPLRDGKGKFGQQQYIETYGGKNTKRLSERLVDKLSFREKRESHSADDKPAWINTDEGRKLLKPVIGLKWDQIEEIIAALCDLLAAREPSWCPSCVQWPPSPCHELQPQEVPNE